MPLSKKKAQNKTPRQQQRYIAPNTSVDKTPAGEYAHYNKMLPSKKTDIKKVTAHLCSEFETSDDPTSVSKIHLDVFRRLYQIGQRENTQTTSEVVCSECGEIHTIKCEKCGSFHEIQILDSTSERTSVTCLKIMADKFFPNKAAIAHDFDQAKILEKITEFVSTVIAILPKEIQQTYIEKWIEVVKELEENSNDD
jgi:hypothetical protein